LVLPFWHPWQIVKNLKQHNLVVTRLLQPDFSRVAYAKGMSSAEEEKTRSYWMGWSETSGAAVLYNARHTKEKEQTAGLELQERYINRQNEVSIRFGLAPFGLRLS
jgi:hypothetical protein